MHIQKASQKAFQTTASRFKVHNICLVHTYQCMPYIKNGWTRKTAAKLSECMLCIV